jgi:predicted nucleic acid-binding protein
LNVVDSSGWLEYFADGANAEFFAGPIASAEDLLVPTLSIYEVFKRVLQQRGRDDAFQAVAAMERGRVVDLSRDIALRAGQISLSEKLHMADSIILATARLFEATVWTQDADLEAYEDVRFVRRKPEAGG